jgi:alpha-mannosidase
MKLHFLIGLLFIFGAIVLGQQAPQNYFQGYEKEIAGRGFTYESSLPNVNKSFLLRGQKGFPDIEWQTEVIPKKYTNKYVTFIWLFAMDVNANPVAYQLSVNDKKWFSFSNSKTSELGFRTQKGDDGAELCFNTTMIDRHKDQMGFAILKIPTTAIKLGEAATLKISTQTTDSNVWYMTFKSGIEETINIYQNKVVAKKEGKLSHSISVDIVHVGEAEKASISVGKIKSEIILNPGFNKVELYLPIVEGPTNYSANIQLKGKKPEQKDFTLTPIKEWEIFLVQHTHTDIGYTRPQTEILPEHLRYIDHALDFCDQTDDYPDAAKFRWTCETSWSVREYLKSRPQEQIDRLLKRIKEGRIEATGMFLNFSEIIDESALAAQTKVLRMLKDKGIDVTTAMQNDVNGIAWSMVDNFHNTDVKYLTMGIHAHRARKPFNKPTSFWWQSPAGNRLLAYRSEHYMHGNMLNLNSDQQDEFRNNLSKYLNGLEEKGYPYNKLSLQFSGYVTDNSPPSTEACDIIKEWNEKYEWPKLQSALARDFMIFLDEQHHDEIPAKKVAWPDWWTDGTASAANETKQVRQAQVNVAAATALLSMGKILGLEAPENVHAEIDQIYDNILFYDEHTHGAAESVRDPLAQNTINQWGMKSAYAWDAAKQTYVLEEKALAFLEPALGKASTPTIAVFNTLNWKRSGLIRQFIPYSVIPAGADFVISDADGNSVPFQIYEQREEGAYFGLWIKDVPPFGYKTVQINIGQLSSQISLSNVEAFENKYYRLTIDENKGVVTSIFDKELEKELVDPKSQYSLGQVIYEELANRHELERLTNTNRDTVYKPLTGKKSQLEDIQFLKRENGAIYNSIFLNGKLPVCADERGVTIEIRLYHFQKKIEFLYSMVKLPVVSPEGVYVAFPFKLSGGTLAFEAQGGVVYPGMNQLEGTSSDWNTIQNFAAVKNDDSQIVFVSDEIPLVQFGDINTGRYYYRLKPKSNHVFSWVLNNYWVTNFKASQEGELRWTYEITSSNDNSDMFATKFGWGERVPLKSRVMLPIKGIAKTKLVSRSLMNLNVANLLLVNTSLAMDGKGIILHVREVEGGHAIVDIGRLLEETGATSIKEVNVLEEELADLTAPFLIEHYETKFLKLDFKE